MNVNDVIEIVAVHFGNNQNQLNVVHRKINTITGVSPTLTELGTGFNVAWSTFIAPLMSPHVSFRGCKVRVVFPVPTAFVIVPASPTVSGTATGDDLPSQVSGVVSLRSSTAPSRTRGRIYLPQTTEAYSDSTGRPTGAYLTNMDSLGTYLVGSGTIVGAGGSAGYSWVLYHRSPPQASYPIDSRLSRTAFGTQRRRSQINRGDTSAI